MQRNICHLKTFVHDSRTIEVSLDLVEDLRQMSSEDVYWTLRDLQGPPRFRKPSPHKSRNSLELPTTITTNDGTRIETKSLIDSGYTGSSIHKDFVTKYGIQTHNLPCLLKVYNADSTHNAGGQIEKFAIIHLQIKDHKEQIGLAVTDLGPNTVFLSHDWLKMHNLAINWKTGRIKFQCQNDHIPQSVDEEDEEEDFSPSQGDRLYHLDSDKYIRNVATEVAIKDFKQKKKKKFEEVAPEYVHEYKDVFAKESIDVLPPRRPWDHAIELLPSDHEVDCKVYPLNLGEQKELDEFLAENLKSGRIRPSKSPFASAFFFIKKKDGHLWPIQDYWKLNAITYHNRYLLLLINELVDKLKSAKYYTKFDVRWGYNNIWMAEGDEWKAVFWTNRGLFEPLVMFFGLTNSLATFQMMMNSLFKKLIDCGVVVIYIDDIMIFTKTLEEHCCIVKEVLQILRDEHLYLHHDKCNFEVQETEFLGLIMAQDQVKMDHKKVSAIKDWPIPTLKKQLQGFLGFLNFYQCFMQNFTQIARPLNALTSVKKEFKWTKECQEAFQKLKDTITSTPSLAMPTDTDPYWVKTDGSGIGVSAILSQKHNGIWHPIAFISWFLNDAERNYHTADLEMLTMIFT